MAQNDIDQEEAANMRRMLAEQNKEAVAQRYGETSLNSAEFQKAQTDLRQRQSPDRARYAEALDEAEAARELHALRGQNEELDAEEAELQRLEEIQREQEIQQAIEQDQAEQELAEMAERTRAGRA